MNAADLYAIVKDVPREAWPECVTGFIRGLYVEVRANPDDGRPHAVNAQLFADDAVPLFIGSMTAWLVDRDYWVGKIQDKDLQHEPYVAHTDTGDIYQGFMPTILEALAAACKALAGGGE